MAFVEKEKIIIEKVNGIFFSAQIDRTTFLLRNKSTISKSLEHLIAPLRLSKEELAIDSSLADITVSDINIHTMETIPLFPQSFESDLILRPPKIVDYHHVVHTSKIVPIIAKPIVKVPREKKVRGNRVMKRQFQANILPEFASVEDTPSAKRFRGESIGEDDEEHTGPGIELLHAPPENLNQVISGVFNEFWNMEFEENVLNAFLARIDKRNCADYGLLDFALESCSLPVIQEKLKDRRYTTVESFYYDFSLLFQNILQYFPNTHPAYNKAFELSLHFERQWEIAKTTLR